MADVVESKPVKVYDISKPTPVAGTVDPAEVEQAISSGQFSFPKGSPVPVLDPDGNPGTVDPAEAPAAFKQGFKYATPDIQNQLKFGSGMERVKAGLEGAAEGVAGPLAPLAETKLFGVKPENIRARAEANPGTHMLGQALGLGAGVFTGTGEGALIEGAGKAASDVLGLGGEGASAISQIGAHSIQTATEMGLLSAGDETSKMILNDPNQSLQTAITNIGLSGLIGAGGGAALGSISPIWKATVGDRAAQFIEDFKGRLNEHLANPDPLGAVTDELTNYHKNITDLASEVYGAKGLKAQEVQSLLPEMSEKISQQASGLSTKVDNALKSLEGDPFAGKLQKAANEFKLTIADSKDPSQIFDASEKFKQQLQEWGKFHKDLVPLAEKDFRQTAKNLGFEFRSALEDPAVWGKAADRQQTINKAFKDFLPTLKDFEKKFTAEVAGERVVDPAKIATYMNQLGKPNAELKQEMLENFLKAAEKYRSVINETHANLGIQSPFENSSLQAASQTLQKLPPGAKAADVLVKKGLANVAGKGLGASIGAGAGAVTGHPYLGALIGEHALGPFFSTILPSIVKPLMDRTADGEGFKAVTEYGLAISKGNTAIQKATRALFKPGGEIIAPKMLLTDKESDRLDRKIKELGNDPSKLMALGEKTSYYLPAHAEAMGETSGRVVQYLNSIRPKVEKTSPLDSDLKPSKPETAQYQRALQIAEQPLVVLDAVKNGSITPQDVLHLKNMYPSLYDKMAMQMTQEVSEHVGSGENVPYRTRLGMSLFLGQPLDSSMTPQSIQTTQSTFVPKNPPMPQGAPKRSMNSLSKMGQLYQTPQQARVQSKSQP